MERFTSKLFLALALFFVTQLKGQSQFIETSGDVLLFALPTLTLASTFILNDTYGSLQFGYGLGLTTATTYGLKFLVHKDRPDNSDTNAFPSGHTATVFHSAAFIHKRYGFVYSVPAYLLAGYTAFSRINADKHDVLDILAGATIGIGSNLIFTKKRETNTPQITITGGVNHVAFKLNYTF